MGEEEQSLPVPINQSEGLSGEKPISEIQRKIIEKIFELLKNPQATTLEYPNKDPYQVAKGVDPDYEHGSNLRFMSLKSKSPNALRRIFSNNQTRDEFCVAVIDNKSTQNNQSRGAVLFQKTHSTREILLTRFTQSPQEQTEGSGTYYMLLLSENIHNATGTTSIKATASSHQSQGRPTFAERWDEGSAQLGDIFIYDVLGFSKDFLEDDYKEILIALERSTPDMDSAKKITAAETRMNLAKLKST